MSTNPNRRIVSDLEDNGAGTAGQRGTCMTTFGKHQVDRWGYASNLCAPVCVEKSVATGAIEAGFDFADWRGGEAVAILTPMRCDARCWKFRPRMLWWLLPVTLVAVLAVPFVKPVSFDFGNTSITVCLQVLAPNGPFDDEGVFIRTGWDGPTGSFSHGDTYGLKFGDRLLRLDLVNDPIAAAQRRLPKTVPGLMAAIESKDFWLKFCAFRALAGMGAAAKPALPAVVAAAERGDAQAVEAMFAVSKATGADSIPALTKALASTNSELRQRTAELLADIGPAAKAALPFLKQRLIDPEPRVVAMTAIALFKIDGQTHGAVPVLEKLLADRDPEVRAAAAVSLGEFGRQASDAVPALTQALDDSNHQVRAMSARSLGLIGPAAHSAIPRLVARLDDPDGTVLMWTIGTLGKFGETAKEAVPKLKRLAQQPGTARWAVEALSTMDTNGAAVVIELLHDAEGGRRQLLARALIKLAPQAGDAVPFLMNDLNSENIGRVATAAQVLGHLGERARVALPRLQELLHDEDVRLRVRAAGATWKLDRQTNAVLRVLLAALQDESAHRSAARRLAAETLGDMQSIAKDAVPLLEAMLGERSSGERQAAAEALKKITGRVAATGYRPSGEPIDESR
jgi:HEAT repeat protein